MANAQKKSRKKANSDQEKQRSAISRQLEANSEKRKATDKNQSTRRDVSAMMWATLRVTPTNSTTARPFHRKKPPDNVRRLVNFLLRDSDYLTNINRLAPWNLPATET